MRKASVLQVLEFEAAHLDSLPSAQMYERSFMHRDNLSQVEAAQAADFLITASIDGHIKFWKKQQQGVEFAKHFRAHLGPIEGAAALKVTVDLASTPVCSRCNRLLSRLLLATQERLDACRACCQL